MSSSEGAIVGMGWQSSNDPSRYNYAIHKALSEEDKFDLNTPFEELSSEVKDMLVYGVGARPVKVYYKGMRGEGVYDVTFEGLIRNMERRYRETGSDTMKQEYETFMRITPCKLCQGMRLKKESLAVTVDDKNIYQITSMSIGALYEFLETMKLTSQQELIGKQILKEIRARVGFLINVGLDYLSLSRATSNLKTGV